LPTDGEAAQEEKRFVKKFVNVGIGLVVLVAVALLGLILPVQALGVPFTIYGQVFDSDGTTPVDGVTVMVSNLATGSSVPSTVTASGGWYSVNLGNLKPNEAHAAGDNIEISADDGAGNTDTVVIPRAASNPQLVNLILEAESPTPTPTPYPSPTFYPTPTPTPTPTPIVRSGGGYTPTPTNRPPSAPTAISGPSSGYTGTGYSYSTAATDADGDNVQYEFDWGDGTSSWTSLVNSGYSASQSHAWSSPGMYYVRVQTTDAYGLTSGWSSAKTVTIASPTTPISTYPTPAPTPPPMSADAVHYNTLIEFLPGAPSGWDGEEPFGQTFTSGEGTWSMAMESYTKSGNEEITADVGIMDSAYQQVGWWAAWQGFYSYESADGYAKTVTVEGYPAWEAYTKDDNQYVLYVGINDRFVVFVNTNSDRDTLYDFADAIDFDGVSALGGSLAPTTQPVQTPAPTPAPTPSSWTPTPAPTPTPKQILTYPAFGSVPPFYIIGAAVLVIMLMAGIGISRRGRRGGVGDATKPKPPSEPPKPEKEAPKDKSAGKSLIKPEQGLIITSAFGYKGANILHKIKVENPTIEPMSDLKIHLFVPEVFLLKENEKLIALLKPSESKTVTFEIRPTGECGDCEVSGRVTYYDYASKKTKEEDVAPKTLSIVCPLLKLKKIDEDAWRAVVSELTKAEETTKEREMPAKTVFEVTSDILKDMNMYMLPASITETPQLYRATARFYAEGVKELKYAAQIEVVGGARRSKLILKAWAEKEEALTGFYHGILDELEKRIQVKGYIEDNIVQHFYHIGTVVKDSVVQRSVISAGGKKKCPRCGMAVSEDEKFCPECREELK